MEEKKINNFAVYDPKTGQTLMEFDSVLAAKKFARQVAKALGHGIVLVDKKDGLFTDTIN